ARFHRADHEGCPAPGALAGSRPAGGRRAARSRRATVPLAPETRDRPDRRGACRPGPRRSPRGLLRGIAQIGARPPRWGDRINRLLGVLDRIDHIGVAVEDLDAALEL